VRARQRPPSARSGQTQKGSPSACGAGADLAAAEEARLLVERRYLGGRSVLFPDIERDLDTLRESGARLSALAGAPPTLRDGRFPRRGLHDRSPRPTAVAGRAAAHAASLADAARAAALDLLGDTVGAVAIAEHRLRSEQP